MTTTVLRAMRAAPRPFARADRGEVGYTHGHHESVLRSHRWRTAENSCAHLLPHLRADLSLLDVGCGPATITADPAGRAGVVVVIGEPEADQQLANGYVLEARHPTSRQRSTSPTGRRTI